PQARWEKTDMQVTKATGNTRQNLWLLLIGIGVVPLLLLTVLWPLAERVLPGSQYVLSAMLAVAVIGAARRFSALPIGPNFDLLINQYQQFAERVSSGDLTARLDLAAIQGSPDFLRLAADLNRMVEGVHSVVAELRDASRSVTGSATNILEA